MRGVRSGRAPALTARRELHHAHCVDRARTTTKLAMHVRAALHNGLTPDEIKEVILSAVYRGVPAANRAFAIAQRRPGRGPAGWMTRAVMISRYARRRSLGGGLAGSGPTISQRSLSRRLSASASMPRDRGRVARLREPGGRGQPQRRADGGAAGGAAGVGRWGDGQSPVRVGLRRSSAPAMPSSPGTATSSSPAASSR